MCNPDMSDHFIHWIWVNQWWYVEGTSLAIDKKQVVLQDVEIGHAVCWPLLDLLSRDAHSLVMWLQFTGISSSHIWNLWVPDLQWSCFHLTQRQGTKIMVPVIADRELAYRYIPLTTIYNPIALKRSGLLSSLGRVAGEWAARRSNPVKALTFVIFHITSFQNWLGNLLPPRSRTSLIMEVLPYWICAFLDCSSNSNSWMAMKWHT